jgi:hypothetical protein
MPCLREGEKEHDVTLKPFAGTRGFKSHPVELSQQPERVLRRGAVTIPAKRRQLVQKPCESASKAPFSEPSFWIRRGPCRRHRDGHGDVGLCGVREQGRCIVGFLRNVGSPVVSRGNSATPGPPGACLGRLGAKNEAHRRVSPSEGNEVRRDGWQDGLASS